MKLFKLTIGETFSILVSALAVAISVWAVAETKDATLQARRGEVRNAAIATIRDARDTYTSALCVLRIAEIKNDAVERSFAETKKNLDDVRDISSTLQVSEHDDLNMIEARLDAIAVGRDQLLDEEISFKASLSTEELERVNLACGGEG